MHKIILNIGDIVVSREPAVLETVLGSCVSICLYDEISKIGGMNHFMVPYFLPGLANPIYSGQESMKKLIEDFTKSGANLNSTTAKVFGGGMVIKTFGERLNVGLENVRVAKEVLKKYSIAIINELVCHDSALNVIFCTATGRVFVKKLKDIKDDYRQ